MGVARLRDRPGSGSGRDDCLVAGRHAAALSRMAVSFQFPMFVMPVAELLALDSLQCHEELRHKLVEYRPGEMGSCAFISHTWLRRNSPDSARGDKFALLKTLLSRCVSGQQDAETEEQEARHEALVLRPGRGEVLLQPRAAVEHGVAAGAEAPHLAPPPSCIEDREKGVLSTVSIP